MDNNYIYFEVTDEITTNIKKCINNTFRKKGENDNRHYHIADYIFKYIKTNSNDSNKINNLSFKDIYKLEYERYILSNFSFVIENNKKYFKIRKTKSEYYEYSEDSIPWIYGIVNNKLIYYKFYNGFDYDLDKDTTGIYLDMCNDLEKDLYCYL